MAYVDGISPNSKSPFHRALFALVRRKVGRMIEPVRGYALSFWNLLGVSLLELAFERANRVEKRLKVLAELRVASMIGCAFCIDIGSSIARDSGITEAQLRDLHRWWSSDAFSDEERLVLGYADRLTVTPVPSDPDQMAQLRERFSDPALVELTSAIAHENLRARMNHGLGYESEGFTEGRVCAVPAVGATLVAPQLAARA